MDPAGIFARLHALVGDAVHDFTPADKGVKDAFCRVRPERWREVALVLRDDAELKMDFLQCVTAVDWPKKDLVEVVYHLYSYPLRHSFVIKAELLRQKPVIPSVAAVWRAAEWNEREQFDLFGVGFAEHPDLRRLLLPDDWSGWPMRKDYQEAAAYRGMSTMRPSPLHLLVVYDKAASGAPGEPSGDPEAPPTPEAPPARGG